MRSATPGSSISSKDFLVGQIWLIKSGEKILGPFTSLEVIERIRAKEVMVIDEVIRPLSRWRLIRNEPEFAIVVEEIRHAQMDMREATEIQGYSSQADTDHEIEIGVHLEGERNTNGTSGSFVQTSAIIEDSNSRSAAEFPIDQNEVKDVDFVENNQPARSERGASKHGIQKQQGFSYQPSAKKEHGVFQIGISLLGAAAIIAAGWIFMHDAAISDKAQTGADLGATLAAGEKAWHQGDFEVAMGFYREADRLKPHQPDVVARLAPLLIHIDAQTTSAKRELSEVLAQLPLSADNLTKALLKTSLGLAALASDDNAEATQQFQEALSSSPDFQPAAFDAAMAAYLRPSLKEAFARFIHAGDNPPALLMTAVTALTVQASPKSQAFFRASSSLETLIARSQDYLQEAHLVFAMLKISAGDKTGAIEQITDALDTDPDMTAQHWHDPYLYLEPLNWNQFVPYCQKINTELNSPLSRSMLALCLFKSGSAEKASEIISEALALAPDDALLQSVNAYTLSVNSRFEDARAALKFATQKTNQDRPPRLAFLVNARVCTQTGDTACVEKFYRELTQTNPPVIAAYVGLAEIQQRAGHEQQAQEWLNKAKALSASYRPALSFGSSTASAKP